MSDLQTTIFIYICILYYTDIIKCSQDFIFQFYPFYPLLSLALSRYTIIGIYELINDTIASMNI